MNATLVEPQKATPPRRGKARVLTAGAAGRLVVVAAIVPRLSRHQEAIAIAHAAENTLTAVTVTSAKISDAEAEVLLQGSTEAQRRF